MVEKSAVFVALRRRLFIAQIDVPRNFPKSFHDFKLRVKVVFRVAPLYAAAGISGYRRISVAPIIEVIRLKRI